LKKKPFHILVAELQDAPRDIAIGRTFDGSNLIRGEGVHCVK